MGLSILRLVCVANVYLCEKFHIVKLSPATNQNWQEFPPAYQMEVDDAKGLATTLTTILPEQAGLPLAANHAVWDGDHGKVWRDALQLWSVRRYNNGSVDIVPQRKVIASIDPDTAEMWSVGWMAERMDTITLHNNPSSEAIAGTLIEQAKQILAGLQKEWVWYQKAVAKLKEHVQEFDAVHSYEHREGGKLPRNHVWRPYRFCSQDVLLGVTVLRHVKGGNFLEVDVFLTEKLLEYDADSSVRGLMLFLLCEAYKCGGTMEVRFTNNVEGGQVPREIQNLAMKLGCPVPSEHSKIGYLSPHNSRSLFAALTQLSSIVLRYIADLDLSIERICYVINKAIWTQPEVESILLATSHPDRLFSGGAPPEQRALFAHDLLVGRAALLGGYLDRRLARGNESSEEAFVELEDDERPTTVQFDQNTYAKIYRCSPSPAEQAATMLLPWGVNDTSLTFEVPFNSSFTVFVRARDAADLRRNLARDINDARSRRQTTGQFTFVLVPFDFYDDRFLPADERARLIMQAAASEIGILACPESTQALDVQVRQRMMTARIIREE